MEKNYSTQEVKSSCWENYFIQSTMLEKSENWYDESFWQVDVPKGWTFSRNRTVRGFPYIIKAESGSFIKIGVGKYGKSSGYNPGDIPDELESEEHQRAYLMTLSQARNKTNSSHPKLEKHEIGLFLGFTFNEFGISSKKKWSGCFSAKPWMFYISFSGSHFAFKKDSQTAISIISTIEFFPPLN